MRARGPEGNRHLRLDCRLEVSGQYGSRSFGSDGHRDRIAIHDGGCDEVAAFEIVNDVDGDPAPPGQRGNARILRAITVRAVDECRTGEIAGFHATRVVAQRAFTVPRQDLRIRARAEHGDPGVALQKQAQLGHRNLPGAGDDDAPAREAKEDRKMLHGDCPLRFSLGVSEVYRFSIHLTGSPENMDIIQE